MSQLRLENIKRHGIRAKGRNELIAFLNGKKLTRAEAMKAKCYDCMGYFADGTLDCKLKNCPMYDYRPYKRDETTRGK